MKAFSSRFRAVASKAILLLLAVSFCSCAKVADPLPPLKPLQPAVDLTLRQTGNRIELEFEIAQSEIAVVEVLMSCGPQAPDPDDFQMIGRILPSRMVRVPNSSRFSVVTTRQSASPCYYVVLLEDPAGRRSDFSNVVRTP